MAVRKSASVRNLPPRDRVIVAALVHRSPRLRRASSTVRCLFVRPAFEGRPVFSSETDQHGGNSGHFLLFVLIRAELEAAFFLDRIGDGRFEPRGINPVKIGHEGGICH